MARRFAAGRRYRRRAKLKEQFLLLRETVNEFLTDNCTHLAASISYYALFCIFPLSLAFIAIMGFIINDADTRAIETIGQLIPVEDAKIRSTISEANNNIAATSFVVIAGLLWGGSAVFSAIRKSLNTAWGVKTPRPFHVERLMELGMMIGAGILLLVSFGLTYTEEFAKKHSGEFPGSTVFAGDFFWNVVLLLASTMITFLTILILYRFVPNTRVRWGDVWGGALIAAIGFEITKQVFVWYSTEYQARYSEIYGFASVIISLMIWVYITALVFLFCAKLTSVYSRRRTSVYEAEAWKSRRKAKSRIRPYGLSSRHFSSDLYETGSVTGRDPEKH